MNYSQIYDSLIEKGKIRTLNGYKEHHHIVPRCLGGSNQKDNMVYLTPEEHYLAHLLLVKMYPNEPKLIFAAKQMTHCGPTHKRSNKFYGWLKRKFAETQSKRMAGRTVSVETRRKLSIANLGKIVSLETRQKQSLARKGKKQHWAKKRLKATNDARVLVKCFYCDKTSFNSGAINRWHNDNCKHRRGT